MKIFFLIQFIVLLTFALSIKGDCQIYSNMVEGTNRIFTYRDEAGAYQLLRTETVPSGLTLHMFCHGGDVIEYQCQDNGQFTTPFPMRCSKPMVANAKPVRDNECAGQMYSIGHQINGAHLELFRSCYDARNGRVLYAESDVYYKSYFPRRPFVDVTTDEIVTPAEGTSYIKRNIYSVFCSILGDKQDYWRSPYDLIINRGHLVASADFLFVDQMSSTFRYINFVPQCKSINDGNWEKIERWVRSQIPRSSPFHIKTGGIDVLNLADVNGYDRPVYLYNSKLPVPQWIYKVVRDVASGKRIYVFLSFNSVFQKNPPSVPAFCQAVSCPFYLSQDSKNGYIFCCNPEKFPY
ncbi:uncharacterized protein LOC117566480 isoform X1 [Drosophila albomicans]|uniref:Uncharacterized protein LOC117566480 isoform X1 n=2 Tax=Drosophila albomicans TaxID=7291 RepID=A0A9C6T6T3_DROAB|nr:uncharacterized protein LOC117566480 isoform X1 [Drosophila albomicans]XP_051860858.1 uncharacterized protein LOC117566480 isoform X1 [Drosophila albomicans]XP_051860859.1 uncharacterized protein LOC117566480 isoform X1 [Drosophila albomicans]